MIDDDLNIIEAALGPTVGPTHNEAREALGRIRARLDPLANLVDEKRAQVAGRDAVIKGLRANLDRAEAQVGVLTEQLAAATADLLAQSDAIKDELQRLQAALEIEAENYTRVEQERDRAEALLFQASEAFTAIKAMRPEPFASFFVAQGIARALLAALDPTRSNPTATTEEP